MNKNIYLKELKNYWKPTLYWSFGLIAFFFVSMAKYKGYADSGVSINELFADLPAAFGAIFGINTIDLGSAGGFYAIIALYLAIMLGVHSVLLGSGIFSKEETEKTAEFLFVKPISRSRIYISKFLAAFTATIFLSFVVSLIAPPIVGMFNEGPSITSDIFFLMPAIVFIQTTFLMIGALFASIMKKPKRAGMASAAVLLGTFVISAFLDVADRFEFLKYITPFKYFDLLDIYANNEYSVFSVVAFIIFVVVSFFVSRGFYIRRDLDI